MEEKFAANNPNTKQEIFWYFFSQGSDPVGKASPFLFIAYHFPRQPYLTLKRQDTSNAG